MTDIDKVEFGKLVQSIKDLHDDVKESKSDTKEIKSEVSALKDQVIRQNGRIGNLERIDSGGRLKKLELWRSYLLGAGAILLIALKAFGVI